MHVAAIVRALSCVLFLCAFAGAADGAAVKAGAPEHLVAAGGECVRLFHSSGAVGCRSLSDADMAPLFPIASAEELARFASGAAARQDSGEKYALVLPEALLGAAAFEPALARVAGLFVYPDGANATSFAAATPQGAGTVDGALNPFADRKVAWNPAGTGLLDRQLPFPVVLLQDAAVAAQFVARAQTNVQAGAGATYKAFMKYYFGPAEMDSRRCLAFQNIYGQDSPKCDPIGGQSAWAVRGDPAAREIVLAMSGMDASALSHVLAPGANTGASGLVALLAAAHALRAIPDADFGKRLVFAAFQAEKYGFVGSRRFLADLQQFRADPKGACAFPVAGSASPFGASFCTAPMLSSTEFAKLALADVAYAIAVDQVGVLPKSGNFTVHVNPNTPTVGNGSATLVDALVKAPSAAAAVAVGATNALPPTPLLSFVNDAEFGKKDLVSAVLAGYDSAYTSAAYNSRHDVFESLDVAAVTKASQVLAEALYQLAAKAPSSDKLKTIQVERALVAEMLQCVSADWRCALMTNYSTPIVATLVDYLGMRATAWPAFQKPTTLYAGPLNENRHMLVKKLKAGGNPSYFTVYNQSWVEDTDRVKLFPNAYETFTRAFLAAAMQDASAAKAAPACTKNQECPGGGKGMECVYPGVCAAQSAYFHLAMSPGLARTRQLGVYAVVNDKLPLWTEPQWATDIGSYVFPDPGSLIGWLSLLIGAVITGVGVVLARVFLARVEKMKLL
ncbi:hypothetical protein PybrP1_009635 [[Pythium] brassicae (nom. inval.)]|nr:hypothetical protein PybrP1_009635 [[Pythium] brassicae (nom. inval.)]